MSISASLLGIILLILVPCFAGVSYYLGKRKTTTPIVVALMGGFLALIPLLGIIFIMVLIFKQDLPQQES
ncbi:hypothetical protein J8L70_15595 [Pseudoalteromonas sp. MMG010]|uniref:hypothetical protein n=1 Tax=Pseudoalteromonas sp. MMG010 TaxID=2822685 RepID=UPI001B3A2363|nr:hypothetical protein [Pseudoalteromonas sp. MMG010]MBQ4834651.1 hypothetical protein [Pseudoalteromonas sp. MMG010]